MNDRRGGRAPSQRQLRVGEELRHVLAEILGRGDVRDPDLSDVTITVTEVRISPDLRNATAFVVPLGGVEVERTIAALRRAAPYLRSRIARAVQLRLVPTLSFEADTSFDYAGRIDRILHAPEVERDLDGDHDAGTPGDDD